MLRLFGLRTNFVSISRQQQNARRSLRRFLFEQLEERRVLASWSGDIPNGTIWSNTEVQRIVGDVRVPLGSTLTIQPGTIIKFNEFSGYDLIVEGRIVADGSAVSPIVFTSLRDDTGIDGLLGTADDQDTNANGPTVGGNGDWNAIQLMPGSTGNIFDEVEIRYGGAGSSAALVASVPFQLSNSMVRNSSSAGVRLQTSNATLTNNEFRNNSGAAISMDLASNPTMTGVIANGNGSNALALDSGTLIGNGNWDDPDIVYRLSGDVTVPATSTLTIGAGQVIKFRTFANDDLIVDGKLVADGTPSAKITFTSDRDDSIGGDTNNNGLTTGGNGDWNSIQLRSGSSGHILDYVDIRYGGANSPAMLAASVPMTFTNSTVSNSSSVGIRLQTSNATLTNNIFQNNSVAAISMDLASNPSITGVTMQGNGSNALVLDAGTIVGNGFWDDKDVVYRLSGDVTVPAGKTLTVGPSQIVKFRTFANDDLIVDGKLIADGSSTAKITFTSDRDDTIGGDTNNNGSTTGGNGDWNGIHFTANSSGHLLDYVDVRYGGAGLSASLIASAPITMTNSTIRNSTSSGVRLQTSNSTLTNNVFQNNSGAAISMDLASNPSITGVTMQSNGANALVLDAGTIVGNGLWNDKDIVYRLSGDVTVPAGRTLTIGPGQVVKFRTFAGDDLIVDGKLTADGTPTLPIIFTSDRDDTAGGDTNNNGNTVGGNGDWNSIQLRTGSSGHVLDNVDVRFGGAGTSAALIASVPMTLSNSVLANSSSAAVRLQTSNATLTSNTFKNNSVSAISMDLASNPSITGVTMQNNGANALVLDAGTLVGNGFWNDKDIVYRLTGDVTVPVGKTLTIGAGQILKFRTFAGDELIVDGKLIAKGTIAEQIFITSDRDDSLGGDTNNNGLTTGGNGDWNSIQFKTGSAGHVLDNVQLRYGGANSPGALHAMVPIKLTNSLITNSSNAAVRLETSNSTLTNNTFNNNSLAAISMDLASNPAIVGVTTNNNGSNALILDSGTIVGNGFWNDKDIVYRLTGDVTVPAGSTLTIGPGQIVKFRTFAGDDLIVNGKLIADGTFDLPITFTSDRDDPVGGDTNNNGSTEGYNGDWGMIQLNTASTGNIFDYVQARNGAGGQAGTIVVNGGSLAITNSKISRSNANGIIAIESGNLTVTNSIINRNSDAGVRATSGATATLVNNTIDSNARGAAADGSTTRLTLTNNLITHNSASGISRLNSASVTPTFNDVYNPKAGSNNYDGLPIATGTVGNIDLDPKYFNLVNDEYSLKAGSPAVDAGTSAGAPSSDSNGKARFDDPNVINRGGGSVPYFDMGAIERVKASVSDIDLMGTQVSGPTTGTQGQLATFTWSIINLGVAATEGTWKDAIYLSSDRAWSPDDLLLGTADRPSNLGVGQSYSNTASFSLPGVKPGEYFFLVNANSDNQVFEGKARANNIASSDSRISMTLPELTVGVTRNDSLTGPLQAKFYKVSAPVGSDFQISLQGTLGNSNEVYIKYGQLPTAFSYDARGIRANQANQSVSISNALSGDYFVLVRSIVQPNSPQSYSLLATVKDFSISSVTPSRGSATGQVTIQINGAQFAPSDTVQLVSQSNVVLQPVKQVWNSSDQMFATFELTGRSLGQYNVRVLKSGGTNTSLAKGFEVIAGQSGRLSTSIYAPSRVRLGRDFQVQIDYRNEGDTDLIAPVFRVIGKGFTQLSLRSDLTDMAEALELIAINPNGNAGVLPPGASGRIVLYGRSASVGDEVLDLEIAEYPTNTIDWAAIEPRIRPTNLTQTQWDSIFASLKARIGNTWDDYRKAISQAANLIADPASLAYSLRDAFQLLVDDAMAATSTSVTGFVFLRNATTPLESAHLQLKNTITSQSYDAVSRSDGTFLFRSVPNGTYTVSSREYVLSTSNPIVVNGSDVNNVQLRADLGATISGGVSIRGFGEPLPDMLVTATSSTGESFSAFTDQSGRYTLSGLRAGSYVITTGDGRFYLDEPIAMNVAIEQSVPHTNLTVSTASLISGKITDSSNAAISNAFVSIYDPSGAPIGISSTTAADGKYTLRGVPAGIYTIQANIESYAVGMIRDVQVWKGSSLTNRNMQLAKAGNVQGVTQTTSGEVLPFAVVAAMQNGNVIQVSQSDNLGSYQLIGLPAGTYQIKAVVPGYQETAITTQIVATQTTTPPAIMLSKAGTLQGKVRRQSDSIPIGDVFVTVSSTTGTPLTFAITNALGEFSIKDIPLGNYRVSIGSVGSPGIIEKSVSITAANPDATLDFLAPIVGEISGRVFASNGSTPQADSRVSLLKGGQVVSSIFSDNSGNFKFLLSQTGAYEVRVQKGNEWVAPQSGIIINQGTVKSGLTFVSGQSVLMGKVTDKATGMPIQNVDVYVRSNSIDGIIRVSTDVNGSFDFRGPADASLQVIAQADNYAFLTGTATLAATPVTMNFELEAGGGLTGMVSNGTTNVPLAKATIAIRPRMAGYVDGMTAVTDSLGRYRIASLAPGAYDIAVVANGMQSLLFYNVSVGNTVDARNFNLATSKITVSGKIADSQGRGLPNVLVEAVDSSGNAVASGNSQQEGTFSLDTLPEGIFRLVVSGEGFAETSSSSFTVANGDLTKVVNVTVIMASTGIDTSYDPSTVAPTLPLGTPAPSIIAGALDLIRYIPKPRRLSEETTLPSLPVPTCKAVIETHRELEAYIQLREKMFQAWQANYETGRDVKTINQAVVGLDVLKLSGTAASLFLNTAKALKTLKYIKLPDNTLSTEVLESVKGLVDRYDKYFFKFYNLIQTHADAISRGKEPPGFSEYFYAAVKGVKQAFDDIVKLVGDKDSLWGKASPFVGALMGLYDVYKDFTGLQKDFSIAVERIRGISQATEDAGTLYAKAEGDARSLRDTFDWELAGCNERSDEPKVTPAQVPPPAWAGGPSAGGASTTVTVRTSFDPNDKRTVAGFGTQGFVRPAKMPFRIDFENDPNAGATIPAQEVFIEDELDNDWDLSTFTFTSFGFDNREFEIPAGLSSYETTIDLRPEGIELLVPVKFELDIQNRRIKVAFRSLDPQTLALPDDLDAGFLPVNDKTKHNGEGFLTYEVSPKASLASGTVLTNQASIVFDVNAPILTPTTTNTIDVGTPTSQVTALPAQVGTTFTVTWAGQDDANGSGIASYNVFVSDNGGPYTLFKDKITTTSASFTGLPDHTYRFYSVATDNVGYQERAPLSADAVTVVKQLAWQNPSKNEDVNNDGKVFPIDALLIINELNAPKFSDPVTRRLLSRTNPNAPFLDVNGDGFCYPVDALLVINELNRRPPGGESGSNGEAEGPDMINGLTSRRHQQAMADIAWLQSLFHDDADDSTSLRRKRAKR